MARHTQEAKSTFNPSVPTPNGHMFMNGTPANGKKRVWMESSDDENTEVPPLAFAPGISKMNGHSTPAPRKKTRASSSNNRSRKSSTFNSSLQEQRKALPIYSGKDALIQQIRENEVTVLLGETGSGKTTQIPQYLLEAGLASDKMIAVTQPRRVAAISLATRVAEEQGCILGSTVGYQVRFEECTSIDTKIKYVTDGMLVRELLGDPLLGRYSVIVIDEAHERTLRTDLLIANLKNILAQRNQNDGKGKNKQSNAGSLKVIIMSATLDAEKFSHFFGGAKVLYVKGRQHPVKLFHTATGVSDYVDAACRTFFQIHLDQPPGDVLIFMPGQEDIESLDNSIKMFAQRLPKDMQMVYTCPLYAALSSTQQYKTFLPAPAGTRKCIIATNIAETSITVPGVKYVIDSGKFKEKNYIVKKNGHMGFDALIVRDITKSSAMQRAGRAGREGPGCCFRLFTEAAYNSLATSADPEIRRCSLASSMLELKCLGFDMDQIDFMDPPDFEAIASALKTLLVINAIDRAKVLTPAGRDMSHFPLEPMHACAVLASRAYAPVVTSTIVSIVSILSATSKVFLDPSDPVAREEAFNSRSKFRHPSGDHLTRLAAVIAYDEVSRNEPSGARKRWCRENFVNDRACAEILNIRTQVRSVCEKLFNFGIRWNDSLSVLGDEHETGVLRSLTAGYAQNAAFLQPDGSYRQVMGMSILKIHPSSVLADKKAPAIIYDELVHTSQIYARGVSSVPRRFIADLPVFKANVA